MGFRHPFAECVGKTEKQRIARSEYHDRMSVGLEMGLVLCEYVVQRYVDGHPRGIIRQQGSYNLPVPYTAREVPSVSDQFLYFGRKEG